jgi:hypothetical protein
MAGRTLDEGFAFLESRFGARLNRSNVDLPDHAVAHGAAFDPDPRDLATLSGCYAEAASLLESVKGSDVRCWPHHFDIATLHDLGGGKSIGIGLAPGDQNLWPYPDPSNSQAAPAWFLSC